MRSVTAGIRQRLSRQRTRSIVSIQIFDDVIIDLKDVAARLGYSNHESLIRSYIGRGLRDDLETLEAAQTPITNP